MGSLATTLRLAAIAALGLSGAVLPQGPAAELAGFTMTVSVADSGDYFVYDYSVTNSAESTWGLGAIEFDISATMGAPGRLATTGDVMDVLDYPNATAPVSSRVAIGPISPDPWSAFLAPAAVIEWAPPAPGYLSADSVAPGETKSGFGVRSPYLPGLREVRAAPTYQSCCQEPADPDGPTGRLPRADDFAVAGWTIGPRYHSSEVTQTVLHDQATAACNDIGWIDDAELCGRLLSLLDHAGRDAEATAPLHEVLDLLKDTLVQTGTVHSSAYWLLQLNTTQLIANRFGAMSS